MIVPQEFRKLCLRVSVDVLPLVADTPEEMIEFVVDGTTVAEARTIISFLDDVLSGRHSDDAIELMWAKTPTGAFFGDADQLKLFLTMVRERLQKL